MKALITAPKPGPAEPTVPAELRNGAAAPLLRLDVSVATAWAGTCPRARPEHSQRWDGGKGTLQRGRVICTARNYFALNRPTAV